jgi:hypothetical protein
MISIGFDVIGLDQNAIEDQEGIEKSSKFCELLFEELSLDFYSHYF